MSKERSDAAKRPVDRCVRWWRWPENKLTGVVPWFVILRRAMFWLPLAAALCLGWLSVLLAYGFDEANRWWRSAT